MKNEYLFFAVLTSMLISSCATMPETRTVEDIYGSISINLHASWLDKTLTHQQEHDEILKNGKVKLDSGIRFLLYLETQNKESNCLMRELSYSPGEVGYYWSLETLASEIANFKDTELKTSSPQSLLKRGYPVPIGPNGAYPSNSKTTEIVSSNRRSFPNLKKFEVRDGWETVRSHSFNFKNTNVNAFTWTDVTEFPMKEDKKRVIFVSECTSIGFPESEAIRKEEVTELLQSINLLH